MTYTRAAACCTDVCSHNIVRKRWKENVSKSSMKFSFRIGNVITNVVVPIKQTVSSGIFCSEGKATSAPTSTPASTSTAASTAPRSTCQNKFSFSMTITRL